MGRLKQLLPFRQGTFLSRAIRAAATAGCKPVIVVVGSESDTIRAAIASERVEVVYNSDWKSGMGSSVSAGVRSLSELAPECGGVMLLVADQPLVREDHLRAMRDALVRGEADAVAAEYDGTLGVPALFRRKLFTRLAVLQGPQGAKSILAQPDVKVSGFPLPEAAMDIDTPDQLLAMTQFGEETSS